MTNADQAELDKFSALAHRWWDPQSEFKPLHEINPLRLNWIDGLAGLSGKRVIDVGCGGGILAESMAEKGAAVTGHRPVRKGPEGRQAAPARIRQGSGIPASISAERSPKNGPEPTTWSPAWKCSNTYPIPPAWSRHAPRLCKPGGWLFFSTLNRNPKSYLFAIIGAEYVLKLLPKGTHDWSQVPQAGRTFAASYAMPASTRSKSPA